VVPGWVYKKLETEKRGGEELKPLLHKNASLFFFADEFREREKRLSILLSRGLETDETEPLLFGGYYLAGTGRDPKTEQGWVRGVFGRLLEEQDHVSWTESELADDAACRGWARVCYLASVLLVLGSLGVLAWIFRSWYT
jgi:hypothetical protein